MRLWLDDVRPAPPGWTWATTVDSTIQTLREHDVYEISLDYDLDYTDGQRKGDEVLKWLAMMVDQLDPFPVIHFHTANPQGGAKFAAIWQSIEARWGIPWATK